MSSKNEFELIVHQGQRPLWQTIFASACFTLMFYFVFIGCKMFYVFGYTDFCLSKLPSLVEGIVYCFCAGLALSVVKSVFIDLDQNKLISRYAVGPFSHKKVSTIPALEYVSVFKDTKDQFQVNLWYKGNKHYKMYVFENSEPAFIFAKHVAMTLHLDLLNATKKGNFQWVEVR